MALLLLLNGDLPLVFPGHERRLYVFACRRKTCRRREGSVRALRGVRASGGAAGKAVAVGVAKKEPKEKAQVGPSRRQNVGESLFGVAPATAGAANP
ncbi:hypothetical protein GP486_004334, partial [Trichoglossum hirsutum]